MEIENVSVATRQRIYDAHQEMTNAALVQVFQKTEEEARKAVNELWRRYENAPQRERDLLLHNDPVALACDLAEQPWEAVPKDRLAKFNETRRLALEQQLGIF